MRAITPPRREWLAPALLIVLGLVPAVAGTSRLAELAGGAEITEANERFFAMPLPVVLHILAVIPFSILGAFQFAPSLRRGKSSWHRLVGRILAPLGLVAALSGLWMTHFYALPETDGELVYVFRVIFGTAMVVAIVVALNAVRRRDFAAHGAWMTRGYAIGLGAGTQVFTHLPYFILVGQPDELSRGLMMGAGWIINVLAAEWIIRNRSRPPKHRSPTTRSPVRGLSSERFASIARDSRA
jgi:uncharacterized membrane protein